MSDEDKAIEVAAQLLPAPNKGGRPTLLTPEIQKQVVASIHAGAYPYQAAVAAGISPQSYYRWMDRGKEESKAAEDAGREPDVFGAFYNAVTRAKAMARIAAEIAVKKENPLAWLMKGPGRERPGEPGWSDKVELTAAVVHQIGEAAAQFDPSRLTDEELDALDRIYTKARLAADSQ